MKDVIIATNRCCVDKKVKLQTLLLLYDVNTHDPVRVGLPLMGSSGLFVAV